MGIVLETPRLALREMTPGDLDFVAAMLADPEVMQFYPSVLPRTAAEIWLRRQLWRYEEHGRGLWLVLEKDGSRPVGQVGLAFQDLDGVREPEIGYLVHRPYWRRGYAAEAASGVKRYAFEERGYPHVISLVRPENVPSQGVARKLGMEPVRETEWGGFRHLVFLARRPTASAPG